MLKESPILFRAKRTDNNKICMGYLFEHYGPPQPIAPQKPSEWYILYNGYSDWNLPRPVEYIKVIPETIEQFTGKYDEDNRMIFKSIWEEHND